MNRGVYRSEVRVGGLADWRLSSTAWERDHAE